MNTIGSLIAVGTRFVVIVIIASDRIIVEERAVDSFVVREATNKVCGVVAVVEVDLTIAIDGKPKAVSFGGSETPRFGFLTSTIVESSVEC